MAKIIKNKLGNFLVICLIFLIVTVWIFSGWPQIWKTPSFPPEIKEAKAASVGPIYATAAAQVTHPSGNSDWTSPENAAANDGNKASVALQKNAGVSHYIKTTGFDFSSIPANAQIDGIIVEWEKSDSVDGGNGETRDNAIRIVKAGTIGDTDRSNADNWTTTDTFVSYGGSADKWGDSWTADEIKSSNFGAAISCKNVKISGGGLATTGYIDSVRITVYYTEVTLSITAPENVQMPDYQLGGDGYSERNFTADPPALVQVTAEAGFTVTVYSSALISANNNISASNVKLITDDNIETNPTQIPAANCSGFSGIDEPISNEYALDTAKTIVTTSSGSGTCNIYPTIKVYISNIGTSGGYVEEVSGTLTFTVTSP